MMIAKSEAHELRSSSSYTRIEFFSGSNHWIRDWRKKEQKRRFHVRTGLGAEGICASNSREEYDSGSFV